MKNIFRSLVLGIFCIFTLTHCGLISDQPDGPTATTTTGPTTSSSSTFSKEIGLQCFGQGDLGCAQTNYCSLQGEAGAGLRCCVAGFLQTYFSDNTQTLGKMLGYTPVSFADMKGMSRQDLLDKKALPFGELFLLPKEEAPKVKDLAKDWGVALSNQQISMEELNQRLAQLGKDLEASATCLENITGQVKSDQVEKDVFGTEQDVQVTSRDLHFLRFSLSAEAYLLQMISHYGWGFEKFPSIPLSDDFLKDINGKTEGDSRWGEISDAGAEELAGKFGLLSSVFSALKLYSDLKDKPSLIDDYLNWRLTPESQSYDSGILKAANESLQDGKYVDLPEDDYQVNLSALSKAALLPNSLKVADSVEVLNRDEASEVQGNKLFFQAWAWNVVRPKPIAPPPPKK